MNKLFTKIVGGFLGLAMTIGVGVMVGNNANESTVAYAAVEGETTIVTFDFEDNTAHRTSGNNSFGTNTYSENGATITTTKGDCVTSGTPINGTANFMGRLKSTVTAAAVEIGPIDCSGYKITTITYKTKGATGVKHQMSYSDGGTSYTNLGTATAFKTSNTDNSETVSSTGLTLSDPENFYVKCNLTYSGSSGSNQDARVDDIVIKGIASGSTAATGIELNKNSTTIIQGGSETLTATITPNNATDKTVAWDVSPKNQGVTVTNGTINVANNATTGNYTVTASANGGTNVTATCTVTVTAPVAVTGVTLNKDEITLDPGETETLTATVAPNNASNKSVTWESDDESIATVDDGIVTAVSSGSTTITVTTTDGGFADTCDVTVNEVPEFEKISSLDDLSAGSKYLISNTAGTYFMSSTQNNNNRGAHSLLGSVTDGKVYLESGMEILELGGSEDEWTLYATQSETKGYLYAASSSSNYLRTQATNDANGQWAIELSDNDFTLTAQGSNTHKGMQYNANNTLFSCYSSASAVSLWKLVDTTESVAISKNSISGFKGDTNLTTENLVSITANNFTPTNISVTYSTENVASVAKGTISNNIIPLTVSYTGVGTTTATITVIGGKANYTCDLDIEVVAKPSTLRIVESRSANPLVDISSVEIQTSHVRQFSKLNVYVEDTDEQAIEIGTISDYVTISRISGDDCVTISGGQITGSSVGTCVVKFELKSLTSVYDTVTVSVLNDSLETAQTVTFATGMTPTQGDGPTEAIFTARVGNTHFGSTETIPLSYFTFSYENNSATADAANMFAYDFSHGDTVDSTHKSQTIYVFCSLPTAQEGTVETSYSVVVTQKNDPLKSITLTNTEIVDGEVNIERNDSLQLTWALDPTNPTDGRDLQFSVDEYDEGVDVTVSQTGLIAVDANSGLGSAIILVEAKHNKNIYTSVQVNIVLEDMTYATSEAVSWTKVTDASTLKASDIIIIASESKGKVLGQFSGTNKYADEGTATFSNGSASSITGALEFTLEAGSSNGTWKLKNGTNYLHGTNAKTTLCLSETATDITITIESGDATIATGSDCRIIHNAGSTRFSNYTSATSSTMLLPQIYKKSGGDSTIDVTVDLFNAIHNNFGTGKTYEWSDSCPAFDPEDWALACGEITDLANYSDYKLNRAVADANGNEIEQFLAKYDSLVDKFTKLGYSGLDYLGRFANDGINHSMMIPGNSGILSETFNSSIIFVLISLISIAGIGVVMYKRKQTNI